MSYSIQLFCPRSDAPIELALQEADRDAQSFWGEGSPARCTRLPRLAIAWALLCADWSLLPSLLYVPFQLPFGVIELTTPSAVQTSIGRLSVELTLYRLGEVEAIQVTTNQLNLIGKKFGCTIYDPQLNAELSLPLTVDDLIAAIKRSDEIHSG